MRKERVVNCQDLDSDDVWYYISQVFDIRAGSYHTLLISDIWFVKGWFYLGNIAVVVNDFIPVDNDHIIKLKQKRFQ